MGSNKGSRLQPRVQQGCCGVGRQGLMLRLSAVELQEGSGVNIRRRWSKKAVEEEGGGGVRRRRKRKEVVE